MQIYPPYHNSSSIPPLPQKPRTSWPPSRPTQPSFPRSSARTYIAGAPIGQNRTTNHLALSLTRINHAVRRARRSVKAVGGPRNSNMHIICARGREEVCECRRRDAAYRCPAIALSIPPDTHTLSGCIYRGFCPLYIYTRHYVIAPFH